MFTLNAKGRLLHFEEPLVMGIINTTPDSFYAGSRPQLAEDILRRAEKMVAEGADIIDIGGQSTRPGSTQVDEEVEMRRVIPAVRAIHQRFPEQMLSIDTFYADVAETAVEAGASIVNDVSAGSLDERLLPTIARLRVPYVLMHMHKTPQTMQANPFYENVALDVFDFLNRKLQACKSEGIQDIILDPGFGFGKTAQHNFQLLQSLSYFEQLNCPLMVGLSRKATIYKTLGLTAAEALNGSTVMHTIALMNGANILRVHDVREAVEAVKLFVAYKKEEQ